MSISEMMWAVFILMALLSLNKQFVCYLLSDKMEKARAREIAGL